MYYILKTNGKNVQEKKKKRKKKGGKKKLKATKCENITTKIKNLMNNV